MVLKRKLIHRACSLMLALVLCLSAVLPSFAASGAEETAAPCETLPVVIVRGMEFAGLMQQIGTSEEAPAFEFKVGGLLKALGRVIWKGVTRFSFDAALEEVADYAYDLMKALTVEADGSSPYHTGMPEYPESADHYEHLRNGQDNEEGMTHTLIDALGGDHVYYVSYDWRVDPYIIADQISASVTRAMEETGHDRVNLVCASMGGIMTVAYLTKYGYEHLNRVCFMSSTFCGAQVASDCLTGKLEINAKTLYDFFDTMTVDSKAGNLAIKGLNVIGIFKLLEKLGTYILENDKDLIYDRVLTPIFGHMLPLWGLTMAEDYEAAKAYMFGDALEENAAFFEKADALQAMMAGRDALLNEMLASGREIAVVSGYNQPLNPVYESANWSGDRILEAHQTSGFATIAKYGETLGDDYVAADPALLSPDRCVDLSTAHFAPYTYMVKNGPHVACSYGTEYAQFLVWLLTTETSIQAGTNPEYPHFLLSGNDMHLEILK